MTADSGRAEDGAMRTANADAGWADFALTDAAGLDGVMTPQYVGVMTPTRTIYAVTWGKDDRPKLHRAGCSDVTKWEYATGRPAWMVEADDLRDAMWQAGEEQRQLNANPADMDEDPGADVMGCAR